MTCRPGEVTCRPRRVTCRPGDVTCRPGDAVIGLAYRQPSSEGHERRGIIAVLIHHILPPAASVALFNLQMSA